MADQQNLPGGAERGPVGSPGGARSSMSAGFKVDSSSLKELRTVWQGLTTDVQRFNAEVAKLKAGVSTIADLQAALGNVGGGRSNPAAGSTARVAGMRGHTSTVSSSISSSTVSSTTSVGGISTSTIAPLPSQQQQPSTDPSRGSRFVVGAGVAAVGAMGGYTAQHFSSTVSMDYMSNQMARGENGAYSSANKNAAWISMSKISGYQNSADLIQGMSTLQQQGFSMGTQRASTIMAGAGSIAAMNPGMGLAGAAQAYGGMYSTQANAAMMSMGMGASIGAQGVRQDPKTIAKNVLTRIYRGRMPTAQELQEGMQQGAPLQRTLQQFDPATQQAIISYGLSAANGGGGTNDSIMASQNLLGRARSRVESTLGIHSSGMMQQGLGFMAGANDVGGSALGMPGAANAAALAGTGSMLGAGAGKSLLSVGGGMLGWRMGEGLFNKAAGTLDKVAGRGGAAGIAGKLGGAVGGVAGMEAAKAAGATPVYVMNWPTSLGGGPGGGLKSAGQAGQDVKNGTTDVADVAKTGRMAALAEKIPGISGVGTLAGAAPLLAVGAVAIAATAMGTAVYNAHADASNANKAQQMGSDDQLDMAFKQAQAWGLTANPQWKAEYDRTIKPMILAAANLKGQAQADARSRAAAAFNRLNQKYRQSGSQHLAGLVNAQSAANSAAGADFNPSDPWHHNGAPQISQGGGASGGSGGGGSQAPVSSTSAAVRVAEQYLGMTYVYGGSNPKSHFDCSGLTQWSYGQVGVKLPRTAAAQQHAFPQVAPGQAKPGDLVTFGSPNAHHVALYMGGGMMIAAPHTGDKIKIQPVYQDQTEYHRVMGGGAIPAGLAAPGALGGGGTPTGGGSNGAPVSLGGAGATSGGGGMFVEANPSVEEVDALSSALSGGGSASTFGGFGQGGGTGQAAAGPSGGSISAGPVQPTPNAPNNPSGNVALGKQLAAAYGWNSGAEWNALYATFQEESGWSNTNQNPTSTAYGIGQFLNSTWAGTGYQKTSDPKTQINAALKYIKSRYGDPVKEWAFHQKKGYYEKGNWRIARDELAQLHKDEMVVPKKTADLIRSAVANPVGSGGSSGVTVQINCPITLAGKATAQDAMEFVQMIEGRMQRSKVVQQIGAH